MIVTLFVIAMIVTLYGAALVAYAVRPQPPQKEIDGS